MSNEELKKKIVDIVAMAILEADELPFVETTEYVADALIAAGIGDVLEWKHRAELAEKMYSMLRDILVEQRRCGIPTGINCLVENEDCAKCMDIYYVIEAEKELVEERKDEQN